MVFSKWLESANDVLSVWVEFTKERVKTNKDVEQITSLNGWDFPADVVRLKDEVSLMYQSARLTEIINELSESVGKPVETDFVKRLNDLYRLAEKVEFLYNGERTKNQATPDTIKRAYFFGYADNDAEVNELNSLLLDLFRELYAAMLNLNSRLSEMFAKPQPNPKKNYKCCDVDILERVRVYFFDNNTHSLKKTKFYNVVCRADFSSIYNSMEGNKAKVKYMISCLSPLFDKEWYRDSAGSIGFTPEKCSGANVGEAIKNGWNQAKTSQLIARQNKRF